MPAPRFFVTDMQVVAIKLLAMQDPQGLKKTGGAPRDSLVEVDRRWRRTYCQLAAKKLVEGDGVRKWGLTRAGRIAAELVAALRLNGDASA